jgi:D-lyxose ketol-isomerase
VITRSEYRRAQEQAADMIRHAGIRITDAEAQRIEVVDFGLGDLEREGVQVLTLFETDRVAAKVLVLFPYQTEPEHWHPPVGDDPGKEETIRVIDGRVHFCVPGDDTVELGWIPRGKEEVYTARHEILLKPCSQLTLPPGTKHWFQASEEGAVMYSFSTSVRDGLDRFTDPRIIRETRIVADE